MRRAHWLLAVAVLVFATGCLTRRQQAVLNQRPRNLVFDPGESVAELPAGQLSAFAEYERTRGQNVCVLQLAPNGMLSERYHAGHDLTLFVVAGKAIVVVEKMRHFVGPGSAVVIPRFTAYTVMPHESDEEFRALLIYSPPFEGEDAFLED